LKDDNGGLTILVTLLTELGDCTPTDDLPDDGKVYYILPLCKGALEGVSVFPPEILRNQPEEKDWLDRNSPTLYFYLKTILKKRQE